MKNNSVNKVINLIDNKKIKNIYITDEEYSQEKYTDTINKVKEKGVELKVINTITLLDSEQKNNNDDYISIMKKNIELLKEEIYS